MDEQMPVPEVKWIGDCLDNRWFADCDDQSQRWKIAKIISETQVEEPIDAEEYRFTKGIGEVYLCSNPSVRATIQIKLQVPSLISTLSPHLLHDPERRDDSLRELRLRQYRDPDGYLEHAKSFDRQHFENEACPADDDDYFELGNFTKLRRLGCTATPKLILGGAFKQSTSNWVPGGQGFYIITHKVPGVPISDIWADITAGEKRTLRKRLEDAFNECCRCGLIPDPMRKKKMYYDNVEKKC